MTSATERIAKQLAERQNAKAAAPVIEDDEADEATTDDTDDTELEASDQVIEPEKIVDAASGKRMTLAEKQALRKQRAEAFAAEDTTNPNHPAHQVSHTKGKSKANGAAAPAKPAAKVTPPTKQTTSGKKQPSPAQLAAREKFAAASRERAAAKAAEREEAEAKPPVQTPEQIKAAQSAKRKAERAEAEEKANGVKAATPRQKTSRAKKSTETAAHRKAREAADKKREAASTLKVAKPKAAPKAGTGAKPRGDTKAKVHALLAKGQTSSQIREELGLSYAAYFHHAKSYTGTKASAAGRIMVQTPFNEEGKKFGRNKTESVSRSEHMRRQFRSGMSTGDIAKDNGVLYQIAYTAVKSLLGDQ